MNAIIEAARVLWKRIKDWARDIKGGGGGGPIPPP